VISALVALIVLSWVYVLLGAGTGMSPFHMTTSTFPPYRTTPIGELAAAPWGAGRWLVMLLMWWVMMIAMMAPSAAPVMLLHARVARSAANDSGHGVPWFLTASFASGYLTIWFAFASLATTLEWSLERAGLVSPIWMWSEHAQLTGGLLVAAGLYQLTPLKAACLAHCRSPAEFVSRRWRNGRTGAFKMGLVHGAYCLGCCWLLMLLLFAGGVMNLLWIAGLTILVLAEKIFPHGAMVGRVTAVLLIAAGCWLALA
jgi:predicted metal-binding membrane protein